MTEERTSRRNSSPGQKRDTLRKSDEQRAHLEPDLSVSEDSLLSMPKTAHSDLLVVFIQRCHSYPNLETRSLALWLADRFYPSTASAQASFGNIAKSFSIHRSTAIRWTKELLETPYWELREVEEGSTNRYGLTPVAIEQFTAWLEARKDSRRAKAGLGTIVVLPKEKKTPPAPAAKTKTSDSKKASAKTKKRTKKSD